MEHGQWADWAIVKLQECYMRGSTPEETAALLGKSKDEVCDKARALGLVTVPVHESPTTAPTQSDPFPRRTRLRDWNEPALPGIFSED
jgi:hypothetical protein